MSRPLPLNRSSHALLASGLWVLLCISSGGCIALGIPSQRFDDPADGGGMFGDFQRGQHYGPAELAAELRAEGATLVPATDDAFCSDGSPLDVPPGDGSCYQTQAKPPEVPWPRFHPVPTRPVFGPTR